MLFLYLQDTISIGSLLVKQTMDASELSSADKKRAASVILSAIDDAANELLDSIDKPMAFQTKSHTICKELFHPSLPSLILIRIYLKIKRRFQLSLDI